MKITKLITKGENASILNQIHSTILKRNVWRSVWRICMWMLGLKGLKELCREIYKNSTKGTNTNLSEIKKKNCSKHEEV